VRRRRRRHLAQRRQNGSEFKLHCFTGSPHGVSPTIQAK
jgi:hypothetical protein